MDQRRIAVQLYSVRDDCEENLDQSLAKIAGMGYEGVEFAGFYGHPAADVRRMVAEKGLQVVGAHIGMDDLADPAFDRTVEFHKAVGNPTLIVSGLPIEQVTSIPALENAADAFNRTAERLQPLGLRLGYHLHGPDVKPVEGRLPWEVILAGTRENVLMQADIGSTWNLEVNALGGVQSIGQ